MTKIGPKVFSKDRNRTEFLLLRPKSDQVQLRFGKTDNRPNQKIFWTDPVITGTVFYMVKNSTKREVKGCNDFLN